MFKIIRIILSRIALLLLFFLAISNAKEVQNNSRFNEIQINVENMSISREVQKPLEFQKIGNEPKKAKNIFDFKNINLVSGLTEEQFEVVFKNTGFESFDKSLFIKIEDEYNINAILLSSIAINECGWNLDSNTISKKKNNILSIKAYNIDTNRNASSFESKEDCLYYGAGLIRWQYSMSSGKYHNGFGIDDINISYAVNNDGSPNEDWGTSVKSIANRLKTKLTYKE